MEWPLQESHVAETSDDQLGGRRVALDASPVFRQHDKGKSDQAGWHPTHSAIRSPGIDAVADRLFGQSAASAPRSISRRNSVKLRQTCPLSPASLKIVQAMKASRPRGAKMSERSSEGYARQLLAMRVSFLPHKQARRATRPGIPSGFADAMPALPI